MKKLKVGDIILLKPNEDDHLGQGIAQLTNSEFSHSVMVYSKKKSGTIKIIELIGNGINVEPIRVTHGTEEYHNAYVLRLNTKLNKSAIKKSAKHFKKSKIEFDYNSLFLLSKLSQIIENQKKNNYPVINHDHLLLATAELINQSKKASSKQKKKKKVELAHCSQFIYDIFYHAGIDHQLKVTGGHFLSEYPQPTDDVEISDHSDLVNEDSVTHLTTLLTKTLHPILEPLSASPIINERRFAEIHNEFNNLMESLYPIGSTFITPGDFKSYIENIHFIDFYNIEIRRTTRNQNFFLY